MLVWQEYGGACTGYELQNVQIAMKPNEEVKAK